METAESGKRPLVTILATSIATAQAAATTIDTMAEVAQRPRGPW